MKLTGQIEKLPHVSYTESLNIALLKTENCIKETCFKANNDYSIRTKTKIIKNFQ